MLVTITSKRQVTFPSHVLDALGVKPGDRLELLPSPDGFVLRARRVDASRLAPLRGKLNPAAPAFDIRAFREQAHDPALRDWHLDPGAADDGEPAQDFDRVVAALTHLVEVEHVALFASYMVIGEAYVALQHHYRGSKPDAKAALRSVLGSGLVAPTGGDAVIDALATQRGCGLLDRLIVLQYGSDQLGTLTLDRKMAALPGADRLVVRAASR